MQQNDRECSGPNFNVCNSKTISPQAYTYIYGFLAISVGGSIVALCFTSSRTAACFLFCSRVTVGYVRSQDHNMCVAFLREQTRGSADIEYRVHVGGQVAPDGGIAHVCNILCDKQGVRPLL